MFQMKIFFFLKTIYSGTTYDHKMMVKCEIFFLEIIQFSNVKIDNDNERLYTQPLSSL